MSDSRSCSNCSNCDKVSDELWVCEEYGFYYTGLAPVNCSPPNDGACRYWTDDPSKANTWIKHV